MYKALSVQCQRCTKKKKNKKKKITLRCMGICHAQFNFDITFLFIVINNITLLSSVA